MDDAWVTEQTTAVLKELAFSEEHSVRLTLLLEKMERKQNHPSAYQLLGFGIQTLPNWEGEDLAT